MNLSHLLVSPPPAAVWLLAADRVAVVRRDRGGALEGAAAPLPEGAVVHGAMGLQGVDAESLAPVLAGLGGAGDRGRRPAVLLPTSWVRCHLLDVEGIRRRSELEEVVRWRLRKLLPAPPEELRLALEPLESRDGRRRVLCVAGLERALSELENAFSRAGMSVGVLTPRLFAVAEPEDGWSLTVEVAADSVAALAFEGPALRLLRLRGLTSRSDVVSAALGELRLLVEYLRSRLGADGEVTVAVAPDAAMDLEPLERWVNGREGLVWRRSAGPPVPGVELPAACRLAAARVLGGAA